MRFVVVVGCVTVFGQLIIDCVSLQPILFSLFPFPFFITRFLLFLLRRRRCRLWCCCCCQEIFTKKENKKVTRTNRALVLLAEVRNVHERSNAFSALGLGDSKTRLSAIQCYIHRSDRMSRIK